MIVLYLVFMFGPYNQAVTADVEVSNQFSKLGTNPGYGVGALGQRAWTNA